MVSVKNPFVEARKKQLLLFLLIWYYLLEKRLSEGIAFFARKVNNTLYVVCCQRNVTLVLKKYFVSWETKKKK